MGWWWGCTISFLSTGDTADTACALWPQQKPHTLWPFEDQQVTLLDGSGKTHGGSLIPHSGIPRVVTELSKSDLEDFSRAEVFIEQALSGYAEEA